MPAFYSSSTKERPRSERISAVPYCVCAAKTTANGKAGTTVEEHCINVGHVGEVLFSLLPDSVKALLPPSPDLSVSVHDVGKVSPGYELKYFSDSVVRKFAPQLIGETSFSSLHACISAAAIDQWLGTSTLASPVSIAAAAHHGTLNRSYPPDTAETLGGIAWSEERQKLIAQLSSVFNSSLKDTLKANPWLLAGLTCVSDWLGSDEQFFPADRPPIENGSSLQTAHRAVAECGFCPTKLKKGLSFEQVFGFEPRESQQKFIDHIFRPGLYVLEAPMGIGKTEAALYVAYRLMEQGFHQGLYFALPTRLTSDRIHERVTQFLSKITADSSVPKLAHGMAWLKEYEKGGQELSHGKSWFNPSKRSLLYPYAVGTIDQALLSVLNVKHNFVRLFGLAGKVVILDEVHSYDMYTGTLLDELVERLQHIGCTVIILSATLTGQRRTRLAPALNELEATVAYPLLTGVPANGSPFAEQLPAPASKQIQIRMEAWDNTRIANEAVSAAQSGKCVVCIANTVAKAQAWYRAIKSTMAADAFPVGILHARFPMFRREKIEAEWMAKLGADNRETPRPHGCVLIATQIVEQSVDIDADWMLSELAPTDMLLQRMGRLWRHCRDNRPCLGPKFVIVTQNPSACQTIDEATQALGMENTYVYAPYVLMQTHGVWKTLQTISLPDDIRPLIEATYAERDEDPESVLGQFKKKLAERCEHLRKLACSAKDTNRGFPTGTDGEHAQTRYSDLPTRSILLLDGRPEGLALGRAKIRLLDHTEWQLNACVPDFNATRHLHNSMITLGAHLLPERGNIRQSVPWLDRHFFEKPLVLICGDDGSLSCYDGPETSLRYSPEYGIWRSDKPHNSENLTAPSVTQTEDSPFDSSTHDW